jgi:hypothetical protein
MHLLLTKVEKYRSTLQESIFDKEQSKSPSKKDNALITS